VADCCRLGCWGCRWTSSLLLACRVEMELPTPANQIGLGAAVVHSSSGSCYAQWIGFHSRDSGRLLLQPWPIVGKLTAGLLVPMVTWHCRCCGSWVQHDAPGTLRGLFFVVDMLLLVRSAVTSPLLLSPCQAHCPHLLLSFVRPSGPVAWSLPV
jgi:hypothetical protein